MDLTLTDDQELIASTAAEFLASRSPPALVRELDEDRVGYSPALWKEMAELGWHGMAIPADHEGGGANFLELCLVIEQTGRYLAAGPFVPTVAWCAAALAAHGSDAQKTAVLAPIARGDVVVAYARADPGAGWPATGASVTATPSGDGFTLDGTAMFAPFAHVADHLVVIAQHAERAAAELTAFLLPADVDGMTTSALDTVGFDRPCRIDFDGVHLPASDVFGQVGGGMQVVHTISEHGAAAACAEMVGGMQHVLDMTVQYASDRQQFDTPIGAFQAIQHHCADMAVDVLGSRLIAYEAIWRVSEGHDAGTEVAMAKAWVSDAYQRVCALAHQVHGAIGFTREHDLHLYHRHALATGLTFGDADHHWEQVARHLDLPLAIPD